jgi:serine/threonine-protein kinase
MPQPSWIGSVLGNRYRIESLLGQGGMSAVYKATDPNLRRQVAVKLIHPHLATDPEFVRRFEEEAAAVARLRHPNIIQVFDFSHDDGVYYMVLEFLPGVSLESRLRQLNAEGRRMPVTEIVAIATKICEAVGYAHSQNMIHRDLKPANVMIMPQGQPILMDFGIVKMLGGDTQTATGSLVGTVSYMAPEQIQGGRADHRTDIYALGVMLFEMASGQRPFQGDSAPTTMMMHLTHPVPNLRALNPNTPPTLVAAIEKALAKAPQDRFQSAAEMATALNSVNVHQAPTRIENLAPTMREATSARPTLAPAPPPPATPTGSVKMPAGATGNRRLLMGGAAAGALLLLLILCGLSVAFGGQYIGLFGGQDTVTATGAVIVAEATGDQPTTTLVAAAPTTEDNATPVATTPIVAAAPTNTAPPAPTVVPTATPSATPTPVPTATLEPTATPTIVHSGLTAHISQVQVVGDHYEVHFSTTGYTPALPGRHVHFFFNTVSEAQAGVPGGGPWKLYGGPSPFTEYLVADRPAGATQMCILVANLDHSIQPGTGNCQPLP